jgi:Xaa-Pro aminopeptidase
MKILFTFLALIIFALPATPAHAVVNYLPEPKAFRVAPPAPRISDAERQSDLARRRAKVFDAMDKNSMMILFSAATKIYAGDVDFPYRQENNLFYLTNLKEPNSVLVLIKDSAGDREILFLPARNPAIETVSGDMYSPEDARRISGIEIIADATELNDLLTAIKVKKPFSTRDKKISDLSFPDKIYLLLPQYDYDAIEKREYQKEFALAKEFAKVSVGEKERELIYEPLLGYQIKSALPIFADLRLIKSPLEIKLLQHAIDITNEAMLRSMALVGNLKYEYEIQAEVEYTFRRRNADFWGFPSIVGSGVNTTILHYDKAQSAIKTGDLILMDIGAEYEHYTADITRTFPASGVFSKEQAEIYRLVFDAQEAAAKAVKPGVKFKTVDEAADKSIKEGLTKLGLITAPDATYRYYFNGQKVDMPQYTLWFTHDLGHWLGMNAHDVGDYEKPLQAGMIFTNEPGIYVRADALNHIPDLPENRAFFARVRPAFEKYKNIGIRIEDDLLVTSNGVDWMTKALPRKLEDIEAFMARSSKEMSNSGIKNYVKPLFSAVNLID